MKLKLVKRFLQFYMTMSSSDKPHLKYLMNVQMNDYRSVFGRNVRNICKEAQVDNISDVCLSNIDYAPVPDDQNWRCALISELLEMRAGRMDSNLTNKEIQIVLDTVATY